MVLLLVWFCGGVGGGSCYCILFYGVGGSGNCGGGGVLGGGNCGGGGSGGSDHGLAVA